MDTFYEVKPGLLKKASLALGFFDGVHPGHQVVIGNAVKEAQRMGATPGVVTFKEHPRSLTSGKSPPLLTLIDQRLELFESLGIKAALVLSFTEELCRLAPEDYVQSVLVEAMGAKALSVGFNHRFGRNRVGDAELLKQLGVKLGYTVEVAGEVIVDGAPVSSSRIREQVTSGNVEEARRLLGRPFAISGTVDHGEGRGHAIGFPTANITVSAEQVEPAIGVYVAVVRLHTGVQSRQQPAERLPAVVNIGRRPTFGTSDTITTEVHVLDYDANLYGQTLQLEFLCRLRSERKFASVDELKAQIASDVNDARRYFKTHDENLTVNMRLAAEPL